MKIINGWQGRQKIPRPVDFKRGAIEYLDKIDEGSRYYHYVKPYVGGPDFSFYLNDMQDFLTMLKVIDLKPKSNILEVGCGPGWVCEGLALLGHRVLGIDISPRMIEIARERAAAIKFPPYRDAPLALRYQVADAENYALGEHFDAIIYFSTLHHLENAAGSLQAAFKHLLPGGVLFVSEGIKPPDGSEWDRKNLSLMEEYATLECPFEADFLLQLIKQNGFCNIRRYRDIAELYEIGDEERATRELQQRATAAPTKNIIVALAPYPGWFFSDNPGKLAAELSCSVSSLQVVFGTPIKLELSSTNTGNTIWLRSNVRHGFVTLRTKLVEQTGKLLAELGPACFLRGNLKPGEKFTASLVITDVIQPGNYQLVVDMVDEGITWFADAGSKPLKIRLTVTGAASLM